MATRVRKETYEHEKLCALGDWVRIKDEPGYHEVIGIHMNHIGGHRTYFYLIEREPTDEYDANNLNVFKLTSSKLNAWATLPTGEVQVKGTMMINIFVEWVPATITSDEVSYVVSNIKKEIGL